MVTYIKWIVGIIGGLLIAWGLYAGIIRPTTKPNPTTKQEANIITNYTITPKVTFGCANFRIPKE